LKNIVKSLTKNCKTIRKNT